MNRGCALENAYGNCALNNKAQYKYTLAPDVECTVGVTGYDIHHEDADRG
jgi:hypothetical protein